MTVETLIRSLSLGGSRFSCDLFLSWDSLGLSAPIQELAEQLCGHPPLVSTVRSGFGTFSPLRWPLDIARSVDSRAEICFVRVGGRGARTLLSRRFPKALSVYTICTAQSPHVHHPRRMKGQVLGFICVPPFPHLPFCADVGICQWMEEGPTIISYICSMDQIDRGLRLSMDLGSGPFFSLCPPPLESRRDGSEKRIEEGRQSPASLIVIKLLSPWAVIGFCKRPKLIQERALLEPNVERYRSTSGVSSACQVYSHRTYGVDFLG